jgi:hypothetical protein
MVGELELKSPSIPLLQRGKLFSAAFSPLFGKEGKGRFFAERCGNYASN